MISPPLRILVREVNWLGDAVMTTPALTKLRQEFPKAHIALLCPQKLSDLWLRFQAVDEVVTVGPGEAPWTIGWRLQAAGFDTALVFPNSPRAALEVWFGRIPRRIGYARPLRSWCLTQAVAPRAGRKIMRKKSVGAIQRSIQSVQAISQAASQRWLKPANSISHQINEYLHLIAQLGISPEPLRPSLFVAPEETRDAASKFGLDDPALARRPIVALNPGAEYGPAKRWPAANFIAAAAQIQQRSGCVLLILGGRSDQTLADEIHSAIRTPHSALHNLAGKTSLRELMALLRMSRVLVTNDTGPMHLAAAVGTSVVVPFGSTAPELTGPGLPGDSHHYLLAADVPCTPCFRRTCPIDFRCMRAISVEIVVAAALEALGLPRC